MESSDYNSQNSSVFFFFLLTWNLTKARPFFFLKINLFLYEEEEEVHTEKIYLIDKLHAQ